MSLLSFYHVQLFRVRAWGNKLAIGIDHLQGWCGKFWLHKYILRLEISIFDSENTKNRIKFRINLCF